MNLRNLINQKMHSWNDRGYLRLGWAILFEALIIGFIGFAILYTLEVLLPTFITARLSLSKILFFLLLGTSLLGWLGTYVQLEFSKHQVWRSPLFWASLLWGTFLLLVSMIKLPFWSIPLFLFGTFVIGYLFLQVFLEDKSDSLNE